MRRTLLAISMIIPALVSAADKSSFRLSDGLSEATASVQETNRTILDIRISQLEYEMTTIDGENQYSITLPEEFAINRGAYLGPGDAALPTITRLLAIPFDSEPEIRVLSESYSELDNVTLAAAQREELEGLTPLDKTPIDRTPQLVKGEMAGEMRDLKLYSVTISPVQYFPDEKRLRVLNEISLEISHAGSQATRYPDQISEAFLPIYRSILDNPAVFDPIHPTRGAYWIIFPDTFAANIQPLADWKKAKGFAVEMIRKSQIGSNSYAVIKNYIAARFDSCLVKPDYILIVADVIMPNSNGIATREYLNPLGQGDIESDNFYTFLYGNDYFPEIFIGRIAFDERNELGYFTNKLFTYERTPYMDDTGWYLRATVVAGMEEWRQVYSTRVTKLWCREAMMENGFTRVDTFFAGYSDYIPPSAINASINGGVAYVNYRGFGGADYWVPPDYSVSNLNQLSNGPMYPIMTSIVCGTGDFNDDVDVCFGEVWIRANNKGGSGFIGNSNHDAHTFWTNAIDVGIYWGWFDAGVSTLAQAQLMGKMTLYDAFPGERSPGGQVELYFNSYNILGDPEVNCWTGIPRQLLMICPDSLAFGQNRLDVHVQDNMSAPVEGAAVCIWKGAEVFATGFTGADGDYHFLCAPSSPGSMKVTVTAQGYIPIEDSVLYYTGAAVVSYASHAVDDDSEGESSGDGDGLFNASERIDLPVVLSNFGTTDTAFGVSTTISCQAAGITITRSSASYLDIAPGGTATPDNPFLIQVAPDILDGTIARFLLDITDQSAHAWQGIVSIPLVAARMTVEHDYVIDNGNGRIDPGETIELVAVARNTGNKALLGASAVLRTADPKVHVIDSTASLGNCQPGDTLSNDSDHFVVSIDPDIYVGHQINFSVEYTGSGPQVTGASFNETAGTITSHDPIGPDNYGYFCFDNTDSSYLYHPTYNWIDISTSWPYVSIPDEDVGILDLPFAVKYYGQYYDRITISDNGYIAMGETWYSHFYNTQIPSPQSAHAMIAPFWDDFVQNPLRVYYQYDTTNAWFVVGWRNAPDNDNFRNQTFEIVLYDEAYWPTRTDDNEIVFQYYTVQNVTTMSAGICSPDRRDGIGYLFNTIYTPGAANVINGRAIKFTTGSLYITGSDDDVPKPQALALSQNYPNPFNARTTISFTLPSAEKISIDIFNIVGQHLATIADGEFEAGNHSLVWDASGATSGIYFYRLTRAGETLTKRMTLIK